MAKKILRSDERKSIMGLDVNGPVFLPLLFSLLSALHLRLFLRSRRNIILMKSKALYQTQ